VNYSSLWTLLISHFAQHDFLHHQFVNIMSKTKNKKIKLGKAEKNIV